MKKLPSALSNITRIRILSCLSRESKNVSFLIKTCGLSQSAISQHLKKLKDMGVVSSEASGSERFYKLKYPKLGIISREILKFINDKK
jgi:ArsR family transcriptional regulator